MIVAMMRSAQRYSEFVASLASERAWLGKSQMVGVCRASAANQTGLGRHKFEVRFIAMSARLADRKFTLLDFRR